MVNLGSGKYTVSEPGSLVHIPSFSGNSHQDSPRSFIASGNIKTDETRSFSIRFLIDIFVLFCDIVVEPYYL